MVTLDYDKLAEKYEKVNVLTTGMTVKTIFSEIAIVLYECKEPEGYWSILIRNKKDGTIKVEKIKKSYLTPYKYHCWKCKSELNSNEHETCQDCHWLICPDCGACKENQCEKDGIIVKP
jgi:hypothetical protein